MAPIEDDLDPLDRDALERAMAEAMKEPMTAEQIQDMLQDRLWEEVAQFASYHCQFENLRLQPWREAPCHVDVDDPDTKDNDALAMLRRMLAAGLSRYEPNPLQALAAAEAKRKPKK